MSKPSETRVYDLATIVENQTPEQRGAAANAIVDKLREMAYETLKATGYHEAVKEQHPPVLVLGKSRLTSAIKQAIT